MSQVSTINGKKLSILKNCKEMFLITHSKMSDQGLEIDYSDEENEQCMGLFNSKKNKGKTKEEEEMDELTQLKNRREEIELDIDPNALEN